MSNELGFIGAPTPVMTNIIKETLDEEAKDVGGDMPVMEEVPLHRHEGMGRISFLCTSAVSKEITGNGIGGHDHIVWDRRFRDSMNEAREKFYELLGKGYKAFAVKTDGTPHKGRELRRFDPNIEEIVMVAPSAAG